MQIDSSVTEYCQRYKLTEKDRVALQYVMDGWMNKEIAAETNVKIYTIHRRMQVIFQKTNTISKQEVMSGIYRIEKEKNHE